MPSHRHEALLLLFRNRPALAPDLLRNALRLDLPAFGEAQLDSSDLTDIQPAEYRADLVIRLTGSSASDPVAFAIIVEVQLSADDNKRFTWPAYVANLRARLRCPVCLLVVAADESVARWAAKTVDLGGGQHLFTPFVLGPLSVPEITGDEEASADPELAVLSAMAHGGHEDPDTSVRIAAAACSAIARLDEDRSKLYYDLVLNSLSEAARKAIQSMDLSKYEYQSDFARHYVAQGVTAGEQKGRAALVSKQLAIRFGPLSDDIQNRIAAASIAELESIAESLLTASTLQDALTPR